MNGYRQALHIISALAVFIGVTCSSVYAEQSADSLPQPLTLQDADTYRQIFALQEKGQLNKAATLIKDIDNQLLMGHVLAQKYMHPTAYRSRYSELSDWLKLYYDHPIASRVKWLADKRRPKNAAYPRQPKKGYLNGVGHSVPQNFRASIPEHYNNRSSPRKTASIAREVRRLIRRGYPSGALEFLNKKETLRYLTASEESHLRGEISHAYFIFGVDDKAIRQARQAIGKNPTGAWLGHWAGGLAAWRSYRFELAEDFFTPLAENPDAPSTLRSGAAFWAHRSALRRGAPKQASSYLSIAAQFKDNFYGVMALQASGQLTRTEFKIPEIEPDFMGWLISTRGGRRTLALLQIGDWTRAERELRYLYHEATDSHKLSMIGFAARHHMPSLSYLLADIHKRRTGEYFNTALFPLLDPIVDYDVDEALVHAIIRKESSFYPLARSRAKAIGLMQILPSTAAFISGERKYRSSGRHLLHNPEVNLKLGQDYIRHLLNEPYIDGNLIKLLAAYNGGPGNLQKWKRRVDYHDDLFLLLESMPARETRNYVKAVTTYFYMYRLRLGLPTPELDELISGRAQDGRLAFLTSAE